jgi:hypothetical protein
MRAARPGKATNGGATLLWFALAFVYGYSDSLMRSHDVPYGRPAEGTSAA